MITVWLTLSFFLISNLTVHSQNAITDWHQKAIVYQIYPLSFQDSNGDGIGDIKGIISRLDYLQILGINTIWLSPVYPSPWEDHGYDISDYKKIHPRLGTMDDMQQFISEAKKRNIRILMDLVMNHTSDQHPWFQQSRRDSLNGNFRNMYVWKEGKEKPNNWKAMIGGSGWQYDTLAKAWYWASFLPFQPDLNYHNPAVKDSMFSVMEFWINKGVHGFRLDIFNCLAEDSSFKNNPYSSRMFPTEDNPNGFFQKPAYTQNTAATFAFAKEFRNRLNLYSNHDAFSVGEVFGPPELLRSYTENNAGLHSVFLFKALHAGFNIKKWKHLIIENETHFGAPLMPTWVLSNHDKKRFISRIKNDDEKMRLISFIQFTQRGIPFIFQGEELGMRQQKLHPKNSKDPIVKKYGVTAARLAKLSGETINRDECRTPMAWNNEKNGGFSNGDTTWLPISKECQQINVSAQMQNQHSMLQHYRKLISLRNIMPILTEGRTESIQIKNKVLSYKRILDNTAIVCYINFSNREKKIAKNKNADYTKNTIFGEPIIDEDGQIFLSPKSMLAIKE